MVRQQMSTSVIRLEGSIRAFLQPRLKEDGFAGSGRTFRRVTNNLIQVLNVQGSRYGGQFAIDIGIQPQDIPDITGKRPDPKKITEPECEFRRTLSEDGVDQWWAHGSSAKSMDDAVLVAAEVYVRIGRPLLAALCAADSPIHLIMPDQMPTFRKFLQGFGSTDCRMALVLARLRKVQGRLAEAKAFAAYGLEHAGPAVSLRSELQELCHTE
jgi:hypothetical protein